jgi:hypothetical protein
MKRTKIILFSLLAIPFICIACLFILFAVCNFPFNSNVLADIVAPNGDQVCVVQTFKGAEPYQVSYYARRPDGPWVWHYLAHQDDRWRACQVEIIGDTMKIYRGSELRKTASLNDVTLPPNDLREQLPGNYTAMQILSNHSVYYGR